MQQVACCFKHLVLEALSLVLVEQLELLLQHVLDCVVQALPCHLDNSAENFFNNLLLLLLNIHLLLLCVPQFPHVVLFNQALI
ncbi:hypothetical protein EDC96DRAFT_528511 [Choanephora cucurbitarum]|nr:hypothetical protein EDC96DRAFT_528511 [Choanephora cucurbitarum]